MLFNSLPFLIFLPLVFGLYWALSRSLRLQNLLLLIASYVFYGWWDWRFLGLIFLSSVVDFGVGLGLESAKDPRRRKALLILSLAVNLGFLLFFKYFGFFVDSAVDTLTALGVAAHRPTLRIILPVGISFYTFQTLSYSLDIYRGKMKASRDPVAFFAFVSFFPQLVAGPIERAAALLPQFTVARRFDPAKARDGLRQILWGLFKKVVVADNVAEHVNVIFSGSSQLDGVTLAIGAFLFSLQIYGDFSGYSSIAIGTARLFGFSLSQNFAFPYFSRDIGEFWRRWHMTLSSWFRDYVYIPLGGSRAGRGAHLRNLILTFTVSGFWHGANWTFIVWGFLNGLYYLPLVLQKKHKRYGDVIAQGKLLPSGGEVAGLLGTQVLVIVAWVFFRAESVTHAVSYLWRMVSVPWLGLSYGAYLWPLVACFVVLGWEWFQRDRQHGLEIDRWPRPARWASYLAISLGILLFGNFGSNDFIYFQF